jgi:hypothetical protein
LYLKAHFRYHLSVHFDLTCLYQQISLAAGADAGVGNKTVQTNRSVVLTFFLAVGFLDARVVLVAA